MEQSLFSSVSQYAYQYTLASQQLLIESKILFKWRNRLQPYINIGLGGAFSQLGHYTSTPLSPTAGQPPIFTANNQTNFSYSLGVGMEYAMLAKLRLGVGYRYNELGKVSLGNSDNAPESRHLEVKDVTNQAVLATVTYLF
jgi:opacity protein-like surface antigen